MDDDVDTTRVRARTKLLESLLYFVVDHPSSVRATRLDREWVCRSLRRRPLRTITGNHILIAPTTKLSDEAKPRVKWNRKLP